MNKKINKFFIIATLILFFVSCTNSPNYLSLNYKFVYLEYQYKQLLLEDFTEKDILTLEKKLLDFLEELKPLIAEARLAKNNEQINKFRRMQLETNYKIMVLNDLKD